jgi:hypothetical protein
MRQDQLRKIADQDTAFALFDEYARLWLEPLGLHTWMIELIRNVDPAADAEWASCIANPQYHTATIEMNPRRFAEQSFTPLQIESVAVHELVHAILWPGYNEVANPQIPEDVRSYFEEVAADQLAHALMMAKYKSAPAVKTLWQGYSVRQR